MIMKKELLYPFDANYILAKKKRIKRELLAEGERFVDKKIAILGGSTTNDIKLILELFLLNQGIRPSFYESEYNKYYEDAVFDNAELEAFAPDLIYIHTSNRNITRYPQMSDSKSRITTYWKKNIRNILQSGKAFLLNIIAQSYRITLKCLCIVC